MNQNPAFGWVMAGEGNSVNLTVVPILPSLAAVLRVAVSTTPVCGKKK